ncbi:FAD-dependent oxidoreductase [Novosphingobium sp.]|uniref:FAD-dependent oxidoreductase n=1 Tax=Novosphingobium sp. TaxID=1874826 RepID=UPI0025F7E69B|nr:FAD-dependent oxidoreductase [Novosphingobium sp.]MCC6924249.1 FAD-dependent oxidoreductase [Novosphingobium sp.]
MSARGTDPHAIDGKFPVPGQHYDLVVIGGGTSGTQAALKGAQTGLKVLLVDENPVPGHQVGNDVPWFFGGRATAAMQNSERMLETVFANMDHLEPLFDAGVEVQLGTCAWGVYRNGPLVGSLPSQVVGLADAEKSWLVGFDQLVLATGARDLPMAFPGWNQPGVMGAAALGKLLSLYDAFAGRRIVVVGSHELGLETALSAQTKGIEVAAILEVRDAPQADAAAVTAAGIPIRCRTWPVEAKGGLGGVEALVLSDGTTLACDSVVMAIGLVPMLELHDAANAARQFAPNRGGWVPVADSNITAVGNCAGLPDTGFDHVAYRQAWMEALGGACGGDTVICQCEEMTLADLTGVQPPRYLDRPPALQRRSLSTLLADGPPNQDQVKRLTRSGMGQCQGRRCRDQVAMILAAEAKCKLAEVPLATHRAPVRPLPLKVIADWEESEEMRAGWDVWMGIPTQWVPYADIGTPYEEENRRVLGGNMSL